MGDVSNSRNAPEVGTEAGIIQIFRPPWPPVAPRRSDLQIAIESNAITPE